MPDVLRQHELLKALDEVTLSELRDPAPGDAARRAHIELLLQPSAEAWLNAIPNENFGNAIPPDHFLILLQRGCVEGAAGGVEARREA